MHHITASQQTTLSSKQSQSLPSQKSPSLIQGDEVRAAARKSRTQKSTLFISRRSLAIQAALYTHPNLTSRGRCERQAYIYARARSPPCSGSRSAISRVRRFCRRGWAFGRPRENVYKAKQRFGGAESERGVFVSLRLYE